MMHTHVSVHLSFRSRERRQARTAPTTRARFYRLPSECKQRLTARDASHQSRESFTLSDILLYARKDLT